MSISLGFFNYSLSKHAQMSYLVNVLNVFLTKDEYKDGSIPLPPILRIINLQNIIDRN